MKTSNKRLLVLTLVLGSFLNVSSVSAQSFGGFSFNDAKKILNGAKDAAKDAVNEANRLRLEYEKKRADEARRAEEERRAQQDQRDVEVVDRSSQDSVVEQKPVQAPVYRPTIQTQNNRTPVVNNSLIVVSDKVDANVTYVLLSVEKDSYKEQIVLEAVDGRYSHNLYLRDGAGVYDIKIFLNRTALKYGEGASYLFTRTISVENTDDRDMSFLLPSKMVESDSEQITSLVKSLTKDAANDEEAMKKIHAYIIKTVKYDWEAFKDGSYVNNPYNAVAVLNRPLAVCAGYANLLAAMARAAGIRTKVIYGKAKIDTGWYDHAWNEVFINDQWEIVDSTWNVDRKDNKYYFIDEAKFAIDHTKEKEMTDF